MSFLVSFNGQFQPYRLPDNFHYDRVHQLYQAEKGKKVKDTDENSFSKVLEKEEHNKQAINSYQRNTKKDHENFVSPCASDLMTRSVKTMLDKNTVKEAIDLMKKYHIHHLPIMNETKELVGMISDKDLIRISDTVTLGERMQTEVIVCKENTQIQILAMIMLHENIHSMPVIDEVNKMIGIVTQSDILRAIMTNKLINLWG
jgi:CBS domain-containing protein